MEAALDRGGPQQALHQWRQLARAPIEEPPLRLHPRLSARHDGQVPLMQRKYREKRTVHHQVGPTALPLRLRNALRAPTTTEACPAAFNARLAASPCHPSPSPLGPARKCHFSRTPMLPPADPTMPCVPPALATACQCRMVRLPLCLGTGNARDCHGVKPVAQAVRGVN
jgi:hypothetical protein